MNWLDWMLIAMVAAGTFYGARQGLVKEVFALAALVAGVVAGVAYHGAVADLLETWVPHRGVARFAGFAVVSLAVGFAVLGLGRWVRALVHAVFLGWMDALAGGAIGFLKGAFAAWVVLALGVAYLPQVAEASKDSRLAPVLLEASERVHGVLPEELHGVLKARLKALREVWEKAGEG